MLKDLNDKYSNEMPNLKASIVSDLIDEALVEENYAILK